MEESIDPRDVLAAVANILDRSGIPYAVTGGMALHVWGRPRFTADADIIIAMKAADIGVLAKALRAISMANYISEDAMHRALANRGEFNFIDGETGVNVDFWVIKDGPFEKEQLNRRMRKTIKGTPVYFVSPEDLILSKLIWHKESESSRQREDVESVVRIQKKLDWRYLAKWSKRQGTARILRELKIQAKVGKSGRS